jgi:hypothetical protein
VERTSALFVKDTAANTAGDALIEERLAALGFDFETVDDASAATIDATGHAVVVISNSVVSGNVGAKFKSVPQGVLALEPALYDDMGWSLEPGGLTAPTTELFMAGEPTATIANDFGILTGAVTVTNSPRAQGYGFTDTGAADVSAAAPPGWGIFSFPPWRGLPDDSQAAGHRVACFAGDDASADLTAEGVRLLDLAILNASRTNNVANVPLFATFEAAALNQWTATQGSLSLNTSQTTQGVASMSVNASGYTRLNSVAFNTLDWTVTGDELLLDVYVPAQGQPNRYYLGAVQLYLNIPSANVHNHYVGQVELTPQGTGWRTLSFQSGLLDLLGMEFDDASLGIAINTQPGAPAVLLDNLRFSGSF